MLYTGVNRAERGSIQRIGLAVFDDLVHWSKHAANPLLEADRGGTKYWSKGAGTSSRGVTPGFFIGRITADIMC